jgi:hypothetical protein
MAPPVFRSLLVCGVLIQHGQGSGIADTPVQIVGSSGIPSHVGVLQVTENGRMGTVCGMNPAAADVACRQLGYDWGSISPSACSTYGAANLCGEAGTAVAAQDLRCTGGELSVAECAWSPPAGRCLEHNLDTVVYCGSGPGGPAEGAVRLLSDGAPSLTTSGLVEVFMGGLWSPVCGMNPGAVAVACKSMGSAGAAATHASAETAHATNLPQIGGLSCKGTEESVLDCSYEAGEDVYCAASEASSVSCA